MAEKGCSSKRALVPPLTHASPRERRPPNLPGLDGCTPNRQDEPVTLPPNNQSHAQPEAPQLDVVWEFDGDPDAEETGAAGRAAPAVDSQRVMVPRGEPPHTIPKPTPSQPVSCEFEAPRAPTRGFGDVQPATPIRPVAVSFVRGATKPGSLGAGAWYGWRSAPGMRGRDRCSSGASVWRSC